MLDKVETVEYDSTGRPSSRSTSRTITSARSTRVGKFVTCDDLHWEWGDWHSVQTVGVNQRLGTPDRTRTSSA